MKLSTGLLKGVSETHCFLLVSQIVALSFVQEKSLVVDLNVGLSNIWTIRSHYECMNVLPLMHHVWLGQHGSCCSTNMQLSFWNTWPRLCTTRPSFSNFQPSFWFSLKALKAWPSDWKTSQHILKQGLCW